MDSSTSFFRPIRDETLGRCIVTVPSSPTTPLSPSSSNVTGRGGTRSDYRRSTMEYVDSNANSISNAAYAKSIGEDRLIHLIDKLQIDGAKGSSGVGDGQETGAANHIGAAAVAPALLLANHINAPTTSSQKLPNGDVKTVSV